MSAQLQLRLTAHPSAKLIFLCDRARSSAHRNRHSRGHKSLCSFPEITTEPSSTELQRVDIGTSAVPCYKRVPVYNIQSELRLPAREPTAKGLNPAIHSITGLLRKRFCSRTETKPVVRSSPAMVITVAGVKQARAYSKTPCRLGKGEYEPLSKLKGKLREEVCRRSSLSYWR